MVLLLLLAQGAALLVLLRRLAPGRTRRPPVEPVDADGDRVAPDGAVSVIIPALNEAARIGGCLEGMARQGGVVREIVVVDSRSTDGTAEVVRAAAARDPRLRVVHDPPLPAGWIGKVWALQHGLAATSAEWVLNVDADIAPRPGAVAGALAAAATAGYDAVSFSPAFADQTAGEQLVQPALLASLVYRVGAAGAGPLGPDRVMANGQFFLARRALLERHGGYAPARASFSDDVTLARHLARAGARVGFLDGSRLYAVRSYRSLGEMWREWGRSVDLSDATTRARQAGDVAFLALAQALPWIVLAAFAVRWLAGAPALPTAARALLGVNAALVAVRLLLHAALRGAYLHRRWTFWLAPLADPLAVARVALTTLRRPRRWRGRDYDVGRAG